MKAINLKEYYSPMRINTDDNTIKLEIEEWNYILYFLDYCSKQNNIFIQKKAKDFLENFKNNIRNVGKYKTKEH